MTVRTYIQTCAPVNSALARRHSRLFSAFTETVGASLELLGDGDLRKRAVPYVLRNSHVQRGIVFVCNGCHSHTQKCAA
jgi:hypothetical protein